MESKITPSIASVIGVMARQVKGYVIPSVTQFAARKDPYLVLISCILSLRTKDTTTVQASSRLFSAAASPRQMLTLTPLQVERLIYPVGFYRTKARTILATSRRIIDDFRGQVPSSLEELLSIKGVGLKTANLVLGLGFGIPAICVDTHVHRISNRLGWVKTSTPSATEEALRAIIVRSQWIRLNTVMVAFGQNICLPVSPWCSKCRVKGACEKIGVKKSR